jgi:hypothetical protein
MVVLHSAVAVRGEGLQTVSKFTIDAGETATLLRTHGPAYEDLPESIDAEQALRETVTY